MMWLYFYIIGRFEYWAKDAIDRIFRRVAFACRYGHIGYQEAMDMPVRDLNEFCSALSEMIKEENSVFRRD